jgi:hypothetical protein
MRWYRAPVLRRIMAWLVGAVALVAAGCSGDDAGTTATTTVAVGSAPAGADSSAPEGTGPPQALSVEQAEVLATMRLANYRAGAASFATSVSDRADTVELHGVVDWQQHTGSAVFRTAGRTDANSRGLMQRNYERVVAHAGGDTDGPPPPPPDDGTWQQRPIDPTTSSLDAVFLLLLSLASPQPDNPQLLRQTDAAYLGTEIVAGRTAQVFTGPTSDAAAGDAAETSSPAAAVGPSPRLTYWVASDGTLLRLRALVGNQTVNVDFSAAPATPTEYLPDLVTTS